MKMTFRAQKMLDRVRKEGKGDMLDELTLEFIKKLDGKQCEDHNWRSVVNGEPLAFIEADEDQDGTYVNIADCD